MNLTKLTLLPIQSCCRLNPAFRSETSLPVAAPRSRPGFAWAGSGTPPLAALSRERSGSGGSLAVARRSQARSAWAALLCGLLLLPATCLRAQAASEEPWAALGKYQFGQSREPLALIEEQIRKSGPPQYGDLEAKLLAVLQAPDTQKDAKRYICRWLGIVGSADCVPEVARLLTDPDLSHPARIALEKLPGAAAAAALRDALPRVKGQLLAGVISSLGVRRDPAALDSLRLLAQDSDELVAATALAAIGQIGTEEASRVLDAAQVPNELTSALANARIVAATRLAQTGNSPRAAAIFKDLMSSGPTPAIRVAGLKGLIVSLPRKEAATMILDLLQGEDAPMRAATIAAYASSADHALKASVAEELPRMNPAGQLLLLGVLADQTGVAVRRPVLEVLKASADGQVRAAALECLAPHGEAGDVPLIVGLATETSGPVGAAAKQTLLRMGQPGVDQALVQLIASPKAQERAVVLDTLAGRRVESALPALVRLLQGEDAALAAEAAKALGVMGRLEQLPPLAKVLAGTSDGALCAAAQEAARQICRHSANLAACAAILANALRQAATPQARTALLPVLPATGGEAALNGVLEAMKDQNAAVRAAAVRALVSWPDAAAGPHLLELARTTDDSTQAIVALRDGCLRLAQMEEVPANQRLDLLRGVLAQAKRPEEKRQAIAALAEVQAPGALELLENCTADTALRAEAVPATLKLARSLGGVYTRQCLAALNRLKAQAETEAARKEVADAIQAVQSTGQSPEGFILGWMLSGPYLEEGKEGTALFDLAFPPEKPGAAAQWRPLTGAQNGVADLGRVMPGENRVAYLRTIVVSERQQEGTLELGSDDGIKVWLNGQVAFANNVVRPCTPAQDKANVTLKTGANTLLLKITQNGGEWAACARLRGADGKALPGVLIQPAGE
jgi:HEAT repeat protein